MAQDPSQGQWEHLIRLKFLKIAGSSKQKIVKVTELK